MNKYNKFFTQDQKLFDRGVANAAVVKKMH